MLNARELPTCAGMAIRTTASALLLCALAASAAADKKAANNHVAITKIAPRLEGGKLWIKYDVTPKKVFDDEAILVRAACTKANLAAPMRDTTAWPLPSNSLDTAEHDAPFTNAITAPSACQLEFQLVTDLLAMSGEHIATACWNNGKVTDGPCMPAIAETYTQALEAICSLTWRWDSKGTDRDVDLSKALADRVWNQQAKDLFARLLKAPKRGAALQAEAGKVGIRDCALAKSW